jgi:hypothetical protein
MKLLMGSYWYGRLTRVLPDRTPTYEWDELGGQGMLRCRLFIEYFDPSELEEAYNNVRKVLEECIKQENHT